MQNKSGGDGQHKMQAIILYRVIGKYSLSTTQILYLSSSIAISWNVLPTCPRSVFPILRLLVRLLVWFKAELPPEDKLQMVLYYLEQMGGESHPTGLQVSFSGCEMKGDGFLVICCASIYRTPQLYPHVN